MMKKQKRGIQKQIEFVEKKTRNWPKWKVDKFNEIWDINDENVDEQKKKKKE